MKIIKKRKTIALIIALILISILFSINSIVYGNTATAIQYLKNKESNPWSTMALIAAGETPDINYLKTSNGEKAIDIEAPILAVVASGENPRTFFQEDLIAKLLSFHKENQIGDPAILNDDIFGILALISAGEDKTSPAIINSKNFLLNNQRGDGSWSYAISSERGDTNTTAMAAMALLEAGVGKTEEPILKAISYLRSAQNSDGGFSYDPQSPFGTDSDASSDAWILSMIYKLGDDISLWTKNGKTPIDHLESLQKDEGYFQYQINTNEDSFTKVTTAYALIALLGKSYPISIITKSDLPRVKYRIEGLNNELCDGETYAKSPLDLIKKIDGICAFSYQIKNTAYGPYLESINNDIATGTLGWLYTVNLTPIEKITKSASDYSLKNEDSVLWYYGEWDKKLTRISVTPQEVLQEGKIKVLVESLETNNWTPLASAIVYAGNASGTTKDDGSVDFNLIDGTHKVFAEKTGYIRSEIKSAIVGKKIDTEIPLSVTVEQNPSAGGGNNSESGEQEIALVINSSQTQNKESNFNFGKIIKGDTVSKNITIKNSGSINTYIESNVTGDELFRDNLKIDEKSWRKFSAVILKNSSKETSISLSIPSEYAKYGVKNGKLIFWATKTQ